MKIEIIFFLNIHNSLYFGVGGGGGWGLLVSSTTCVFCSGTEISGLSVITEILVLHFNWTQFGYLFIISAKAGAT